MWLKSKNYIKIAITNVVFLYVPPSALITLPSIPLPSLLSFLSFLLSPSFLFSFLSHIKYIHTNSFSSPFLFFIRGRNLSFFFFFIKKYKPEVTPQDSDPHQAYERGIVLKSLGWPQCRPLSPSWWMFALFSIFCFSKQSQ